VNHYFQALFFSIIFEEENFNQGWSHVVWRRRCRAIAAGGEKRLSTRAPRSALPPRTPAFCDGCTGSEEEAAPPSAHSGQFSECLVEALSSLIDPRRISFPHVKDTRANLSPM